MYVHAVVSDRDTGVPNAWFFQSFTPRHESSFLEAGTRDRYEIGRPAACVLGAGTEEMACIRRIRELRRAVTVRPVALVLVTTWDHTSRSWRLTWRRGERSPGAAENFLAWEPASSWRPGRTTRSACGDRPGGGCEGRSLWGAEEFHGWRLRDRRPSGTRIGHIAIVLRHRPVEVLREATCVARTTSVAGRAAPASGPAQTGCQDRAMRNPSGDWCEKRSLRGADNFLDRVCGTVVAGAQNRMSQSPMRHRSSNAMGPRGRRGRCFSCARCVHFGSYPAQRPEPECLIRPGAASRRARGSPTRAPGRGLRATTRPPPVGARS